MGQKFRNRRNTDGYVAPAGIVARQDAFDTSVQTDFPVMGGTSPVLGDPNIPAQGGIPIEFEQQHTMADARNASYPSIQQRYEDIDYEVGGVNGQVDGVPYSTGVVSSDSVENFALTGEQAIIRRGGNPGQATGPVATSDHGALLAAAFAQSQNEYYPNEASQADVLSAI